MARYSIIVFFLILISVPLNLSSFEDTQTVASVLELNAEDSYLTRLVTAISERAHYSQSSVNNESSIKILNEYINTLDRILIILHFDTHCLSLSQEFYEMT